MMTKLLFHEDAYLKQIDADILHIDKEHGSWRILCDRTIFYPGGGGQPADRGTIAGYPVTHLRKQDNLVYHMLEGEPDVSVGQQVPMVLDWEHRYEYMQQHTGQHLISGVLYREYGISTVSIHQGEQYTTIETDQPELPDMLLREVELRAQQLVCSNLEVQPFLVDDSDKQSLSSLRREPQVQGTIRVVALGSYDQAPCGGVHLHSTGEVLLVHCIATELIRGRVRTFWNIGRRALDDYRSKTEVLDQSGTLLSSPWKEVPRRIERLQEEIKQLQWEKGLRMRQRAGEIIDRALESSQRIGDIDAAADIFTLEDPELFKQIPSLLDLAPNTLLCFLGQTSDGKLRWLIAVGTDIDLPFAQVKQLLGRIEGKGGGKHPLWQGIGTNPAGAASFIDGIKELFL